jgi:predicted metal-dependent HD superfamily phosphohydrolase
METSRDRLWPCWLQLIRVLTGDETSGQRLFADLAARYSEPGRHYHTLEHIEALLDFLQTSNVSCKPNPALFLAVWFHDAIYDTHFADNEEQSAAHARTVLAALPCPETLLAETERLILLTKTHQAAPDDSTGQLLLDADLAILGASLDVYDRYARAIRQEYAWVPEERYRVGRAAVLASFLHRPRLYHTEALFVRAEQQARANVQREMMILTG